MGIVHIFMRAVYLLIYKINENFLGITYSKYLTRNLPENDISIKSRTTETMEHTFLCPTKNPNPKVSVVNVILLPFGTIPRQPQSFF
jgi:hypothetical protein